MEEQEREIQEMQSARKIQSVYRGYMYRKDQSLLGLHNFSARVIQKAWREYVEKCKIQRVREILALFRISRAVHSYALRLRLSRERRRLNRLEQVLMFYPSKSIVPEPKKRRRRVKMKQVPGIFAQTARAGKVRARTAMSPRRQSSSGARDPVQAQVATQRARSVRTPIFGETQGAQDDQRPATASAARPASPRRRKFLVELPPPWHQTDPKRLSQAQQDEMLFNQKGNIVWVKKELIPMLWKNCLPMFVERDELIKKNEKFIERSVVKAFICPIPRGMKALGMKTPKQAVFIGDGCLLVVASSTSFAVVEPKTLTNDNLVWNKGYDVAAPMLDIAIHPFSGAIATIDARWNLRLYERGKTVMKQELVVGTKIPKVQKYLHFDKNGLLWVNLWPQKGHLFLIDTLTFQIALHINLESVLQTHRFMRTLAQLVPIAYRDQPFGFAGTFVGTTDVYLFSYDFSKAKALKHPDMKTLPHVKQITGRVYVWSFEKSVYAYELGEYLDATRLIGRIEAPTTPTDICGTSDPDMIYIGCEDCTVHAYLARTTEYQLRIPEQKMTPEEMRYADVLLGPMQYTQSRKRFTEMASYKFTSVPLKIAAFAFSEKMIMVVAVYSNGNMGSVWMVNDSQNVRAMNFDIFEYNNPQLSMQVASEDFNQNVVQSQKKRQRQIDMMNFVADFDEISNTGLMNNRWNPKTENVSLVGLYMKNNLREWYPFLPDSPPKTLSAYEAFHYLMRTGILPTNASTFSSFLLRFLPSHMQKNLPNIELVMNPEIPIRTSGNYNAIVNYPFDTQAILDIFDVADPLLKLRENLPLFQISETYFVPEDQPTTKRRWANLWKREGLSKRLSQLSALEDIVKHEIMARVQKRIDVDFASHQATKLPPIQTLDNNVRAVLRDASHINFVGQPNRNPLLDEKGHKSIYESWSKRILFGRDQMLPANLRCLRIPTEIFAHSQVSAHLDLVRRTSAAMKRVSSTVHSFEDLSDDSTQVVVTEDSRALPLSHYLTIHSFLGGTNRLIHAVRSIMARVLAILGGLHRANVIVRTVCPENIYLNAADNTVTFGNIYDCQGLSKEGRAVYLPLPEHFADPSNPFLPPEYFHEPPRRWTQAFDIWQFGMVLLYIITGFLPKSYGSELMSHIGEDARMPKVLRVTINNEKSPLDDPPVYPRCIFFYDWLKGSPLVGPNERCTGERGECFIQSTESGKKATNLDLDKYKLLPYASTKMNYDETRLFIEIIACCLQIEPEKRPTVEQLLKTYPFNQSGASSDILYQYMRTPNPNVFVSQFFCPVLTTISDDTFHFAMGILSALMFYEEISEDDQPYAFPLDVRANEKVLAALFQMKFMDRIVAYIINRVASRITQNDVNPVVTFKDEMFDLVHRFFTRFVASVDKGTGPLQHHLNEVILSLYAVYAGNPYLRHRSNMLIASPSDIFGMSVHDSAPASIFFHTKLHSLVRYTFESSMHIRNTVKRTPEHNDQYFEQFLHISEAVQTLDHALCFSVDKQRANAIKTMAALWQNGTSLSMVRLFVDFRIPQKIIHCYYTESAKNDAGSFICSAFRAVRLKSYDATMRVLQAALQAPTVFLHCALGIRVTQSSSESMKLPSIEIIRSVLFSGSSAAIIALVVGDTFWSLVDTSRESVYRNIVADAIESSSHVLLPVIMYSPGLQVSLKTANINYVPKPDYRDVQVELSMSEATNLARKIAGALLTKSRDEGREQDTIQTAAHYFISYVNQVLQECTDLGKKIDSKLSAAKKHLRAAGAKPQVNAKETSISNLQQGISDACDVMIYYFKNLCSCWKRPESRPSAEVFTLLKNLLVDYIPFCRNVPHPAARVHRAVQRMFLHCIQNVSSSSPVHQQLTGFVDLWVKVMKRDIDYFMSCNDKETAQVQVIGRYPEERRLRLLMFKALVRNGQYSDGLSPIFRYIVREMMHNMVELRFDVSVALNTDMFLPIRSEAFEMILFALQMRETYYHPARDMAVELAAVGFVSKERKLTETDDKVDIVQRTIALMETTVNCVTLFDEETVKKAETLLKSLKLRFGRKIMNLDILKDDVGALAKPKLKQILSPTIRETWQRPLTSLQRRGEVVGSARVVTKPSRPVSAFSKKRPALSPR